MPKWARSHEAINDDFPWPFGARTMVRAARRSSLSKSACRGIDVARVRLSGIAAQSWPSIPSINADPFCSSRPTLIGGFGRIVSIHLSTGRSVAGANPERAIPGNSPGNSPRLREVHPHNHAVTIGFRVPRATSIERSSGFAKCGPRAPVGGPRVRHRRSVVRTRLSEVRSKAVVVGLRPRAWRRGSARYRHSCRDRSSGGPALLRSACCRCSRMFDWRPRESSCLPSPSS